MAWVWSESRSKKTERLVLLAIADCASEDGSNAYPSTTELMRKTGLSERGVQGAIGSLVALGELFVSRNGGPRGCNRYRVIMATPQDLPPQIVPPAGGAGAGVAGGAGPAGADLAPPQETTPTPAGPAPGTVLEPPEKKISSSKRSQRPKHERRPDVEQLCTHLADLIEQNGSRRPVINERWRDAARLLLDRDRKTVEQITKAIDWCQNDEFWRGNILSMSKLREQYDRLQHAAKRQGAPANGHRPSTTDQRVSDALALKEQLRASDEQRSITE